MCEQCRVADLRCKEVINLVDGSRMGYVSDVLLDVLGGRVLALVVPGRGRFLCFFLKREEAVIPWAQVEKLGDDIILVRFDQPMRPKEGFHLPWR
jgi:YlmC/YmxH family sporulation protein